MFGAYKKTVSFEFEVCGEVIAITQVSGGLVSVEYVRKNGQEDTHMAGKLLMKDDGTFEWHDDGPFFLDENCGEDVFVQYHSQELANGVRDYLNEHGLPDGWSEVFRPRAS